ncbi:hypothetical protein XcvCFBP7113P_12765 [Xanthomonas citri pv. vignicola]|nr:hypothetical protein XcvCFBP7113P_12765 [Xanthomonas citri pv. vignicola]
MLKWHTDQIDWSLPAHRRRALGGMDAAKELTWTYLQRVLRWWAGKDPAANSQRGRRGAPIARQTRLAPNATGRRPSSCRPSRSGQHVQQAPQHLVGAPQHIGICLELVACR